MTPAPVRSRNTLMVDVEICNLLSPLVFKLGRAKLAHSGLRTSAN
jgi:hypothetical protein